MVAWGMYLDQIIYWIGYIAMGLGAIGVLGGVYYYTSYPIKMTYWNIIGSGEKGRFSLDKPKKAKLKTVKDGNAWHMMFKKKDLKPFQQEHIYSGNNVYAFKIGDEYIPAEITFDMKGSEIKPIPYDVKNWAAMELKQNEVEFSQNSFWDDNKYFFMVIITAAVCCALAGVTVYYTYKFAGDFKVGMESSAQAANGLTDALKNFGSQGAPN